MSIVKSRIGFGLTIAVLLVALFWFSRAYLFYAFVLLAVLFVLLGVLLRADTDCAVLTLTIPTGARLGNPVHAVLHATMHRRPLAAKYLIVELELESTMFDETETRVFILPVRGKDTQYPFSLESTLCGEMRIGCARAQMCDVLELFRLKCRPFDAVHTIVYPASYPLSIVPSHTASGVSLTEGLTQNRRGSDHSETFDIREYVPGDDVRTIHWKLSSKTDTLIVREPSDPSHHDLCLLPDLCLRQDLHIITAEWRNAAVALTVELGMRLLDQNIAFYLAVPTRTGLQLFQVRSQRELNRVIPRFLSLRVSDHAGIGLQYFLSDQLDRYFTRLVVLSDGLYSEDLHGLDRRLGMSVVSVTDTATPIYAQSSESCVLVTLPAAPASDEHYRIPC